VAGFGLAAAVALITSGRLGDLYGRRRVFAVGLTLFALASLVCGIAQTSAILPRGGRAVAAGLRRPPAPAIRP
jgi:MFS family permease